MEIHQDTIHEKKYKTFRKRFEEIEKADVITESDIRWLKKLLSEVLPNTKNFFNPSPNRKWGKFADNVMDDIENIGEKKLTAGQTQKGFNWIWKNRRKFIENWVSRDGLYVSERLKDEDFEKPLSFGFVGFAKYYGGIYNIFSTEPIYSANYASVSIEYTTNLGDRKNPVQVHQVYAND